MRLLRALVIDRRCLETLRLRLLLGRFSFDTTVAVLPATIMRRVTGDGVDLIVASNTVLQADPAGWLQSFRALFADAPPPIIVFGAGPSRRVDGPLLHWAGDMAILAGPPSPDRLIPAMDRVCLQAGGVPLA